MASRFKSILLVITLLVSAGCGKRQGLAPVQEVSVESFFAPGVTASLSLPTRKTKKIPRNLPKVNQSSTPKPHRVKQSKTVVQVHRGQTLYSIAKKYGADYRQVARLNKIRPPYAIHPGQKIVILTGAGAKVTPQGVKVKPSKPPKGVSQPKSSQYARYPTKGAWRRPAKGRVIEAFSIPKGNKGIDIGGKLGRPVVATANGKVAYAGEGLKGYGKLIILRHNDRFLSAYAHCAQILVKEGDVVKAGQMIARMGHTGTNHVKLHFEIRRNGKPVNPLYYLSSR